MRIAALFLLIVVILGPTIFIFNPSYKTLEITCLVLQVATWTESYTDLIGKMLGPSSIGMVDCLVSFCRYVYCSYFKGRTVREFILGVLLVPSIVTFLDFSFWSSAVHQVLLGDDIANAVNDNVTALFVFLEDYPFAFFLIYNNLIAGFFVTSSDSGSLVVDNLTSGVKLMRQ
jgi:choline/glycine/proline betaine transport protein